MKKILILALVVIVVSSLSGSVYAQTTTTTCHFWEPWCHNSSSSGNSGYCSSNQYGSQYCNGSGYGRYQNGNSCNSNQYGVCYGSGSNYYPSNNCVNYACSYPSYPNSGYGSSPCPGYPYCNSAPSYQYPQQQVYVSNMNGLMAQNGLFQPSSMSSCSINVQGVSGNYQNQYVSISGEATYTSNSQCPYSINVVSIIPQQQQATTTASVSTTTVTASTSSTTPLVTQPTTDYTPYILIGVFGLLGLAMICTMIVLVLRMQPRNQPQPAANPQGQQQQ